MSGCSNAAVVWPQASLPSTLTPARRQLFDGARPETVRPRLSRRAHYLVHESYVPIAVARFRIVDALSREADWLAR